MARERSTKVGMAKTLKQAASVLGCSVEKLQEIRDSGHKAFRSARIYVDEITKEQLDAVVVSPVEVSGEGSSPASLRQKQIEKLDIENQKKLGELIPRKIVKEQYAAWTGAVHDMTEKFVPKSQYNAAITYLRKKLQGLE